MKQMNPIAKFEQWYAEEIERSTVRIPSACCLTSIGLDGYPNARFVSLKEVLDEKFVITGPLDSRKGQELLNNTKAGLTFWWTATEKQIRIQGNAVPIEDTLAEHYFKNRNKGSQIVSTISKQGKEVKNLEELTSLFHTQQEKLNNTIIERPKNWSGFYIVPKRIEFMEFKENRFHIRELYIKDNDSWNNTILQP